MDNGVLGVPGVSAQRPVEIWKVGNGLEPEAVLNLNLNLED